MSKRKEKGLKAVLQAQRRLHIIFLTPSALLIFGMLAYPLSTVLIYSLQERNLLESTGTWIGFANYAQVFSDPLFWQSLRVSVLWTIGAVIVSAIVGLGTSLLLQEHFPFRSLARSFALFPYIVPSIVVILVFRYLFNDGYGMVNYVLELVGLERQAWLVYPTTSLIAVILIGSWKFYPLFIITLLGRLQMIPSSLYEAARMDGANYFQSFRYVTWPAILPLFMLTLLLRTIWTFNTFDIVYLMNGGGPLNSTLTLPLMVHKVGFSTYDLGYSSAIATIMVLILVIVSYGYFSLQKRVNKIYE